MAGFKSTERYIASRDLEVAVNASVTLQRPLLVKGEPGTGKTVLAHEIAEALGYPLIEWHVKSTTKAQQGLYEYDAVSRLRDSQLGDPRVKDIANGRVQQLHAAHLKRYADRDLVVTQDIIDVAAHGGEGHLVDHISAHRLDSEEGVYQYRVGWQAPEGAEPEVTWQDAERMSKDMPRLVRKYLKTVRGAEKRALLALLRA